MIWLTWRQHRAEAIGLALLCAAVAAILVPLGLSMHGAFTTDGVGDCLANGGGGDSCSQIMSQFSDRFTTNAGYVAPWLQFLPALVGVFVGAPLLGREYEHGTWQLAWTQSISRRRWLTVKIALLALGLTLFAVAFSSLYGWWHGPLEQIDGRFASDSFNFETTTFTAYTLCAFAAAAAAGAFIGRTVTAMAAALALFLAVRIPIEFWARPHYAKPVTTTFDPLSHNHPVAGSGDWIIGQGYADAAGHPLDAAAQAAMIGASRDSQLNLVAYAHEHGLMRWIAYQPADRYWQFQLTEAAIFITLAAALLILTLWRVRRRST